MELEDENSTPTFYLDFLPSEVLVYMLRFFTRLPNAEIWENHIPLKDNRRNGGNTARQMPKFEVHERCGQSFRMDTKFWKKPGAT